MATISEHDISDDNQASAVAEHFKGQIHGTPRIDVYLS
jgi:hypothetical protein